IEPVCGELLISPRISNSPHTGATRVFEGRGDALLRQEAARMITRFLVFCECPVYEFRHALDPVHARDGMAGAPDVFVTARSFDLGLTAELLRSFFVRHARRQC